MRELYAAGEFINWWNSGSHITKNIVFSYSSVWKQFHLHLLLYYHTNLVMFEVKSTVMHFPNVIFRNSNIYINTLTENCKWDRAGSVYLRLSVVICGVVWVLAFRTPASCFLRHLLGSRRHPWLALWDPFINRPDNTPTFSQIIRSLHSVKGLRLWFVTHCGLDDRSH